MLGAQRWPVDIGNRRPAIGSEPTHTRVRTILNYRNDRLAYARMPDDSHFNPTPISGNRGGLEFIMERSQPCRHAGSWRGWRWVIMFAGAVLGIVGIEPFGATPACGS